jgi:hypothetical protein
MGQSGPLSATQVVETVPANAGLTAWPIMPNLTKYCLLLCSEYVTANRAEIFVIFGTFFCSTHASPYVPECPEITQTQGVGGNTEVLARLLL